MNTEKHMEITYEEFINNILETRGRFACGDEYHERHHIVPKCMGGGNEEENLIDLYAREHFEAHRLLALENPENEKLVYAWSCMTFVKRDCQSRYKLTAKEYEDVKKAFSVSMTRENNPMYGRKRTKEEKDKISKALKGENNINFGKHFNEEHRKRIGESQKGKRLTEIAKKKISEARIGKYIGKNNPNSKKVAQYGLDGKLIKIWNYIEQAANELKVNRTAISNCCSGRTKTAGGYQWKYLYDQTCKDGTIIPGAITLGLITEEEALRMLEEQKEAEGES